MTKSLNRIFMLRKEKKMSRAAVAKIAGTSQQQIEKLEKGTRRLTVDWMDRIAPAFDCQPQDLITDGPNTVPLYGRIAAGTEVYIFENHSEEPPEQIEAPPGNSGNIIALEVYGDSMFPAYESGDVLFFRRDQQFNETICVGKVCIVNLAEGGTVVKRLQRGTKPQHYHLESFNAPLAPDVRITWAAPVLWAKKNHGC